MSIIYQLLGFSIAISILVFVHEMGHYLAAIYSGAQVDEFSIGFGKLLFKKEDKRGTSWCIRMLPLGGYVKMHGDEGESGFNIKKSQNIFKSKKGSKFLMEKNHFLKIFVLISGPLANYVFAILLLFLLLTFSGNKVGTTDIIGFSGKDVPAAVAGLKVGDKITGVNGKSINNITELQRQTAISKDKDIEITFRRDNEIKSVIVSPILVSASNGKTNRGRYIIGIETPPYKTEKLTIVSAAKMAISQVIEITKESFKGIYNITKNKDGLKNLSGPIGIAKLSGGAIESGFKVFISFLVMLSISLGFFNLLPIPLLDGGQILFYLCELIALRPLPVLVYKIFYIIGVSLIGLLFGSVMFNDIYSIIFRS